MIVFINPWRSQINNSKSVCFNTVKMRFLAHYSETLVR